MGPQRRLLRQSQSRSHSRQDTGELSWRHLRRVKCSASEREEYSHHTSKAPWLIACKWRLVPTHCFELGVRSKWVRSLLRLCGLHSAVAPEEDAASPSCIQLTEPHTSRQVCQRLWGQVCRRATACWVPSAALPVRCHCGAVTAKQLRVNRQYHKGITVLQNLGCQRHCSVLVSALRSSHSRLSKSAPQTTP